MYQMCIINLKQFKEMFLDHTIICSNNKTTENSHAPITFCIQGITFSLPFVYPRGYKSSFLGTWNHRLLILSKTVRNSTTLRKQGHVQLVNLTLTLINYPDLYHYQSQFWPWPIRWQRMKFLSSAKVMTMIKVVDSPRDRNKRPKDEINTPSSIPWA